MNSVLQKIKANISSKTIAICCLVILVLLTVNSVISIKLQSSLSKVMIDSYVLTQGESLVEYEKSQKLSLEEMTQAIAEVCSGIAESFIYNFDPDNLKRYLASFIKINGVVAVQAFDAENKAFAAAWRDSGIETGTELPPELKLQKEFSYDHDANHEGEKVGTVRIYYTDQMVQNEIVDKKKETDQSIVGFRDIASKSKGKSIKTQILVASSIVVALIVSIGLCIKYIVSNPINNVVNMIKNIAQGEGDLTKRLDVASMDEVGELAKWFNVFIEKLQGIIKDIADGIETLSSSSAELSGISQQMSGGVENVTDKANTVSTATEEMSTNMNTVAAAVEQCTTNTNMVATSAEEMSATIGEIAQSAEKARGISDEAFQKTSEASTNMDALGAAAESIGKVIETITDISEQVNLLALNATIEAARAGDAGKGFAVVANEIKELAKQTAKATQDIKVKIESIQGTTTTTVGQISKITQVIADVNSVVTNIATAVEEQSTATQEIAGNVAQASQGMHEVSENVNQSSSVSSEISRDIADVTVSMNEMSTSSNQVNLRAQELSNLSKNLNQRVNQFKV
jgi:methyl-accepting chemotaxis protein